MTCTLLRAALLLAAVGVQVQGQFGGSGPSCLDVGVGDKESCDDYCGGDGSHMPSSIWVKDSGHCICQNCMLRDCQGHSAGCAMPDDAVPASGEDSVEARSVQMPQAGSASLGTRGIFFAGGALACMGVAARVLQRNRRTSPEERPLVGVDAYTTNTEV